jgi:hypothetical protein
MKTGVQNQLQLINLHAEEVSELKLWKELGKCRQFSGKTNQA